jgi:D-arginine dehydrogenase
MTGPSFDIAIIGAGMAGASLAAAIDGRARVVLLEAESQPGYHATGRSAAFWSESYGGRDVQPLTSASRAALEPWLSPRGCLHIADDAGFAELDALEAEFAGRRPALIRLDRAALEERIPGLSPRFVTAIEEASCRDIDVAGLHARHLADARRSGIALRTGSPVLGLARSGARWLIETPGAPIDAAVLVNAAGAWASAIAAMAGAMPIPITPYRRTVVQLATDPAMAPDMPLVMDAAGRFYFKPAAGGRLWLSPHDEHPSAPQDAAPEELDVAIAIDRFERAGAWHVLRREHAWAGLRSFSPDRVSVYGFDGRAPGFFWFAGQGGFGIQTAPAAAAIGAALLLGDATPAFVAGIDAARYAPTRF